MTMLKDSLIKKIQGVIKERESLKAQINNLRGFDPDEYPDNYKIIESLKRKEAELWNEQKVLERKLNFMSGEKEEDLLSQLPFKEE